MLPAPASSAASRRGSSRSPSIDSAFPGRARSSAASSLSAPASQHAPRPSQPDRQQALPHQHGQVRLGGRHRYLRPGPRVEDVVGLPGQAGADHVGQGQQGGALRAGQAGRCQGIGGLPGLADGEGERALPDQWVAVSQLVRVGHLGGYGRQTLEQGTAYHAGVVGGPTGRDPDLVHVGGVAPHPREFVERRLGAAAGVLAQAAAQRPGDDLGLLVNLLEHEVVEAALLHRVRVPVGREGRTLDRLAADGLEGDRRPR